MQIARNIASLKIHVVWNRIRTQNWVYPRWTEPGLTITSWISIKIFVGRWQLIPLITWLSYCKIYSSSDRLGYRTAHIGKMQQEIRKVFNEKVQTDIWRWRRNKSPPWLRKLTNICIPVDSHLWLRNCLWKK